MTRRRSGQKPRWGFGDEQPVRVSSVTPEGTRYHASFTGQPTPEQIEALDALVEAVRKRTEVPRG